MGGATVTELFGLLGAIVVLAGLAYAIGHGGKTAQVVTALGNTFVNSIKAATAG